MTNNKWWRGCGGKGTFIFYWWECKLVQSLWRTGWRFLKKWSIVTVWSWNPLPSHVSGENSNFKLYMTNFIYIKTLGVQPCCYKWQNAILYDGCIVFHFVYHSFFIHLSVDGHLDCFHILAIVNSCCYENWDVCIF